MNINRALLAPDPRDAAPHRRWAAWAVVGTLALHGLLWLVANHVRLQAWTVETMDVLRSQTFHLKNVREIVEEKGSPPPNPRVAQPVPRTAPVPDLSMPKPDLQALERTMTVSAPPDLKAPAADPALPTPVAALPSARQPSLLPRSTRDDALPVSPEVAPLGTVDVSGGDRGGPGAALELPAVAPVALADENLSSLEPAGTGFGGTGLGSLPEFTEIEQIVPDKVREEIESPEGLTIRLKEGVLFEFNSADLKPGSEAALGKVRDVLMASPDADVRIEGHTDGIGDDLYNFGLSEKRAKVVGDWLTAAGVKLHSLKMVGYGKSRLLVRSGDRDAQAPNRRVEIHIKADKK